MAMAHEHLALVRLQPGLGDAYLEMVDEFEAAGEGYPYNNIELAREDFAAFVRELEDEEQGIGQSPGVAPQVTYVLLRDGRTILGEIRFRAQTAPGRDNIGYNVRPSERRRGYATFMLGQVLAEARTLGLKSVLLAVGSVNLGSVRTIIKHGGYLERQLIAPNGTPVSEYRIPVIEEKGRPTMERNTLDHFDEEPGF
jgi:predicted acetyltransferase